MPRPSIPRPLSLFMLLASATALGCADHALAASDGGVDATAALDTAVPDALSGAETSPGACSYGGQSHPVGSSFPDKDGCNTCTCLAGGAVACTDIACLPRDGGPDGMAACDFSTRYSYGPIGGNGVYVDRTELAPGNKYTRTRAPARGQGLTLSCSPAMPPCGAQDVITAYDLEVHDLPLADVQAALAQPQPPLYGYDSRPVDGTVFELKRADGRGFLVGSSCEGHPGCRAIPAGVAQLAKRLRDLDAQQLAAPGCQGLR
jgi:hypothetical protein